MPQKYPASRTISARLHRLNGQIIAIEKMVTQRRACAEILYQVSAARAGLEQIANIIFEIELQKLSTKGNVTKKDVEKLTHAFSNSI